MAYLTLVASIDNSGRFQNDAESYATVALEAIDMALLLCGSADETIQNILENLSTIAGEFRSEVHLFQYFQVKPSSDSRKRYYSFGRNGINQFSTDKTPENRESGSSNFTAN